MMSVQQIVCDGCAQRLFLALRLQVNKENVLSEVEQRIHEKDVMNNGYNHILGVTHEIVHSVYESLHKSGQE